MSRGLRILFFLSVLTGLGWYGKLQNPAITLPMCLKNPQKYDGVRVEIGTEVTVREIRPDGFVIGQMGRRILVSGDPAGLKVGDYLALSGTFHGSGFIELHEHHVARGRRWKIALSILPVFVISILLLQTYRIDFARRVIRER